MADDMPDQLRDALMLVCPTLSYVKLTRASIEYLRHHGMPSGWAIDYAGVAPRDLEAAMRDMQPQPPPADRRRLHSGDTADHDTHPYPHACSCLGCRMRRRCNHCGVSTAGVGRCTNGRCDACHNAVCGDGGATSPGHAPWRAK